MAERYLATERPVIFGQFGSGDTVTMDVYDVDGNPVAVDDDTCDEIGATGVFVWSTEKLTNPIPILGVPQYLFVMNNGSYNVADQKTFGGFPDRMLGLSQENFFMDNTVYDGLTGVLKEARIRLYADGYTPGGATGVIATYNITATPAAIDQVTDYKQEKV